MEPVCVCVFVCVYLIACACMCVRRRTLSEIVCFSAPSVTGAGAVRVRLSVDRASLPGALDFQYIEDPTVQNIEPQWSITR